jgi:hypothetical protein
MTTKKTGQATEPQAEPTTPLTTFERLSQVQQGVTCRKDKTSKSSKNGNYTYTYRNVASIIAASKPFLQEVRAAITLTVEPRLIGVNVYVYATAVFHNVDTGETVSSSACARENLGSTKMDPSQCTGSATTYARKYAMEGLLLLDEAEHDPDSRVYEPPEPVAAPVVVRVDPLVVANHLLALQTALDSGEDALVVAATNSIPIVQRRAVWNALNDENQILIKAAKARVEAAPTSPAKDQDVISQEEMTTPSGANAHKQEKS